MTSCSALMISTPPGDGTIRPWLTAASAATKVRESRRPFGQLARAKAHPEGPPRLSVGDVESSEAGPVLPRKSDQVAPCIEHRDSKRGKVLLSRLRECGVNDRTGLR